jgi:hypothetical protein
VKSLRFAGGGRTSTALPAPAVTFFEFDMTRSSSPPLLTIFLQGLSQVTLARRGLNAGIRPLPPQPEAACRMTAFLRAIWVCIAVCCSVAILSRELIGATSPLSSRRGNDAVP